MTEDGRLTPEVATRAQGLRRLAEFLPRAGKTYRELRGYDFGPGRRDNVSRLSAYLRYRLLSESEVAQAVLGQHTATEAQTFLNELLLRTYQKGWLEGRPQVYLAFRRALVDDLRRFSGTEGYHAALQGSTGIPAFDSWNEELTATGYLHHRARMWYASIWIFTLRLPWTLGAAHFHEHLLDGDPASNTLAWRWVGGLQIPGKHVLARADEIFKYTQGRFSVHGQLNEAAASLTGPPVPPSRLLQLPQTPSELVGTRYALWVTPDDLSPEITYRASLRPTLILYSGLESIEKGYSFSPPVRAYVAAAVDHARTRLESVYGCPVAALPPSDNPGANLAERLLAEDVPHLVYYQPPVGPWQELAGALTSRDVGLRYFPLRHGWDALLFPHASKGYLQFQKNALPVVVRAKGKL